MALAIFAAVNLVPSRHVNPYLNSENVRLLAIGSLSYLFLSCLIRLSRFDRPEKFEGLTSLAYLEPVFTSVLFMNMIPSLLKPHSDKAKFSRKIEIIIFSGLAVDLSIFMVTMLVINKLKTMKNANSILEKKALSITQIKHENVVVLREKRDLEEKDLENTKLIEEAILVHQSKDAEIRSLRNSVSAKNLYVNLLKERVAIQAEDIANLKNALIRVQKQAENKCDQDLIARNDALESENKRLVDAQEFLEETKRANRALQVRLKKREEKRAVSGYTEVFEKYKQQAASDAAAIEWLEANKEKLDAEIALLNKTVSELRG